MRTSIFGGFALVATCAAVACSGGSPGRNGFGGGGSSSGSGGTSSGGSGGTSSGGVGSFGDDGGGTSSGGGACSPNSANYDIPGNNCDDDGDGKVDTVTTCDGSLSLSGTAHDLANAMGICQDAAGSKWGIVSATFDNGFAAGSPSVSQHAIIPKFGSVITPREGSRLGVLSSGNAFQCDDANPSSTCSGSGSGDPYFKGEQAGMTGAGTAPPGYPKAASGCQNATDVYDAIGLNVQIKVPANAQGLQFDFDFYSGEWPEYVCTDFNDAFVAWLTSTAYPGTGGDLNISFDSKGNPVSVNNGFFEHCTQNATTGCAGGKTATAACSAGPGELQGTGFYNLGTYCPKGGQTTGGGATGWLTTKAPVKQGETITVQFIIWDTGDQNWDSSVLVDNFQWQPGPTQTGTGVAQ
jgi:hypothetical protein